MATKKSVHTVAQMDAVLGMATGLDTSATDTQKSNLKGALGVTDLERELGDKIIVYNGTIEPTGGEIALADFSTAKKLHLTKTATDATNYHTIPQIEIYEDGALTYSGRWSDNNMTYAPVSTSTQVDIVVKLISDNWWTVSLNVVAYTLSFADNAEPLLVAMDGKIDGKMSATPSGDPMHYMYILASNNQMSYDVTNDIWSYLGDKFSTKTVRESYMLTQLLRPLSVQSARGVQFASGGFTFPLIYYTADCNNAISITNTVREMNVKYIVLSMNPKTNAESGVMYNNLRYSFGNCYSLIKIFGIIDVSSITSASNIQYFGQGSTNLQDFKLSKLNVSFNVGYLSKLSIASVYFMIANAGTAAIKITLHADVYDSIFDDEGELTEAAISAGITEDLLSTKSNVELGAA